MIASMGSADATPAPAVSAIVIPPTAAAILVNDSLTMCGPFPKYCTAHKDGDDNFSAVVVCDRGYQAPQTSSRRKAYRGAGRKHNCVQVSAYVSLVTIAEMKDSGAAVSAPCMPGAWCMVDVYVKRLVSVTKRFRLTGLRQAKQQQPTD